MCGRAIAVNGVFLDDTGSRRPDRRPDERRQDGMDCFGLGGIPVDEEDIRPVVTGRRAVGHRPSAALPCDRRRPRQFLVAREPGKAAEFLAAARRARRGTTAARTAETGRGGPGAVQSPVVFHRRWAGDRGSGRASPCGPAARDRAVRPVALATARGRVRRNRPGPSPPCESGPDLILSIRRATGRRETRALDESGGIRAQERARGRFQLLTECLQGHRISSATRRAAAANT